jgi:hypothetical protein
MLLTIARHVLNTLQQLPIPRPAIDWNPGIRDRVRATDRTMSG